MLPTFAVVLLGVAAAIQSPAPDRSHAQESALPAPKPGRSSALPSPPAGPSTVIGGEIREVDPVRDELTLRVFGGRTLKLLFDERTQVFKDGSKISVLKLHPEEHASIETTLEGTRIFALKIHTLSQLPEGQWQGQVISHNVQSGDLTIKPPSLPTSITLHMPPDTPVMRAGQDLSKPEQRSRTELVRGSLVEVKFHSGAKGVGVVTEVDVLATPGAEFVFSGQLSRLDLRAGRLVIAEPGGSETHEVIYDPSRFPVTRDLREGMAVKVTANFNGSGYVAREITIQ